MSISFERWLLKLIVLKQKIMFQVIFWWGLKIPVEEFTSSVLCFDLNFRIVIGQFYHLHWFLPQNALPISIVNSCIWTSVLKVSMVHPCDSNSLIGCCFFTVAEIFSGDSFKFWCHSAIESSLNSFLNISEEKLNEMHDERKVRVAEYASIDDT